MTVKFAKAGTFKVYCDLHPGMAASVTVAKKGAKIPTAKQDAAAVKKQGDAAIKAAKGLESTNPGADTVDLGVAGKGGVRTSAWSRPTSRWRPARRSGSRCPRARYEAHTATFGPGDIEKPDSYLGAIAASFESPAIDPRGAYPSDVPPVSLSSTTHGNGFWNTGVLDVVRRRRCPTPRV